jgi:DNA-binding CsgD family transcriptional regulator
MRGSRVASARIVSTSTTSALLERGDELRRIDACLAAACAGAGGTLAIEGRAGIGKTALLTAARAAGRAAGMRVLSARGAEIERDFAYGAVRQLLEPALAAASQAERAELLSGAAELAAPLVVPDPLAVEADAFGILHGLYWLCANLAGHGPLLVAVDDAHWSDAASLRFLEFLARRADGLAIAIVLAARPDGGADALLADPQTEVVRPAPLSAGAVAELVDASLGRAPEAAFAEACRDVTGGVPYLVAELVRALAERGLAPDAGHVEEVRALGPRTISRAILGRLGRLAPDAGALARAAAVLGPGAELADAAALAGLEPVAAAAAADTLAAAGLLAEGRPLQFAHPIVRTAVDADLPAGLRAGLHSTAARRFAAAGAPPERVAVHLLAADPAGEPWAVEALRAAAREAVSHGAPDSATTYLRRALSEPPDASERGRVLLELGFAESYARDPQAAEHLEAALETAEDRAALVRATMALGRILQLSGRHDRAAVVFDRTLRRLAGTDAAAELSLEGALVSAAQLQLPTFAEARARIPSLRARAEAAPDAAPVAFAPLAFAAGGANEPADVVAAMARRALAHMPRPVPESTDRPPGFYHACVALIWCERFDEVAPLLDAALADAQRLGSLPHFVALRATRAWLGARAGLPGEAVADARLALESPGVPPFFRAMAMPFLIEGLIERGELGAAEAELEAAGWAEGIGDSLTHALVAAARGRLRVAAGRPAVGLEDLLAAGERLEAFDCAGPGVYPWRSEAALTQVALGAPDPELAEGELALAREFGAAGPVGMALRALGLVTEARGGDGTVLLREAVDVLSGSPATLEHARALADLGAALRRAGHRAEAREPLRGALDLAHRRGARALAERAQTELVASGARPRRLLLSGVDALTPSERRVADMAAAGRTNREIAQGLFVTARTVEGHLTHVFQKLGIESRADLPRALAEPRRG